MNIPSGKWNTWKGSHADYAQLIKVAYLAAKSVNPKARIVLFGDPYWYDMGAMFKELLTRLTADPGAKANNAYFDVANVHLYSRPKDLAPLLTWYKQTLRDHGLDKPLWVSETNAIPYDDPVRRYPKGGYFATLRDQASYIVQAFAIDLAMGADRIEVNRMIDGTDFKAGGEPFGLIRNDRSQRPAYAAYRTAATLYAGVTSGSLRIDPASGVYTVTLRKPGATISVVWDQSPTAASVQIPALGGTATAYDALGAARTVAPAGGVYDLRLEPAAGNTNSHDPRDYVMGGPPVILVQQSAAS